LDSDKAVLCERQRVGGATLGDNALSGSILLASINFRPGVSQSIGKVEYRQLLEGLPHLRNLSYSERHHGRRSGGEALRAHCAGLSAMIAGSLELLDGNI
jgi:hypothetical protein